MDDVNQRYPDASGGADYFSTRRDMWIRRTRDAARERDILASAGETHGAAKAAVRVLQYALAARFNNLNALLAARRGEPVNPW